MKSFFYPRSVAVFGVSESRTNLGRIIIENLERFGFPGAIVAVGTRAGFVGDIAIGTSLPEEGEAPELAVLLIPAADVPAALEACGRRGTRRVVVESGGFSEFRAHEGSRMEETVRSIGRRFGMRIVGPNCFGIVNRENGLVVPFFVLQPRYLPAGRSALVSQSGGLVYDTCMLSSVEQVGISKIVSIGNKIDVDENDMIEYLMSDEATDVIGLYLENFSHGRRLMELAATTEKPVVVLKGNRSPAGREIAQFHTAALAGDDAVARAALSQAGITRVDSFREMIQAFKVFSLPPMKGNRIAIVSRSGGHGVLGADAAHEQGFILANLSPVFFEAVKTRKRNVIRATNPVDVGDVYDLGHYGEILDSILREPDVDGVVFVCTFSSETDGHHMEAFLGHAGASSRSSGKPVVVSMVTNRERWFSLREASKIPLFVDVAEALKALAWSRDHYGALGDRKRSLRRAWQVRTGGVQAPSSGAVGRRLLTPFEAYGLLARYGLPVAPYAVANNEAEGRTEAERIGYPVALKTARPEVIHKSDRGGVTLDILDSDTLARAMAAMGEGPFFVQKMAPQGVEVIVGGKRDPEFGPTVLFGLGGIFVEALGRMALRVAPLSEEMALEMIDEVQGSQMLKGFRGKPPADVEALCRCLVAVSRMLVENEKIINLDINPLIVFGIGDGCLAVDTRIEVRG
jgi:acetyltransferase